MKIILDCNVMISAGLTNGICREVLLDTIKNHQNFISDEIIIEYREVIRRSKFSKYHKYLFELFALICKNSSWIKSEEFQYNLPDKDDEIYLNTALSANADLLVIGNLKDYPEIIYNKLKVITPREYLAITKI